MNKLHSILLVLGIMTGKIAMADIGNLKLTIQRYIQAGDLGQVETLNEVLHKDYRVVALTAKGEQVIIKKVYLNLIKSGKIGGQKRTFKIKSIKIEGKYAKAEIIIKSKTSSFHDHIHFIKNKKKWQLINNVTYLKSTKET